MHHLKPCIDEGNLNRYLSPAFIYIYDNQGAIISPECPPPSP